jgi:hypothetical protein
MNNGQFGDEQRARMRSLVVMGVLWLAIQLALALVVIVICEEKH